MYGQQLEVKDVYVSSGPNIVIIYFLNKEFFFETKITSFTWAVVQWVWRENVPGNKVFDVVIFEGPDVLAEFGGVSVFSMAGWCGVHAMYISVMLLSLRVTKPSYATTTVKFCTA